MDSVLYALFYYPNHNFENETLLNPLTLAQ